MKLCLRCLLALSIVLLIKNSKAQQKTYFYKELPESVAIADSATLHLAKLFSIGLYDSAINYCSHLRRSDALDFSSLELALATAYRYKGNTDMAYQYVINSADYSLKLNGGGGNAFSMLENYKHAYPLAADTVLEQIIATKVKNYYLAMDYYPHPQMGLKFIMLYHALNKAESHYNFLINTAVDAAAKNKAQIAYDNVSDSIHKTTIRLIEENQGFYSLKEIGPGFNNQFSLINANSNPAYHSQLMPYFEKAFKTKQIEPYTYVNELVNIIEFTEKDVVKLASARDSLCAIHGCPASSTIITHNGDTLYFKPEPMVR